VTSVSTFFSFVVQGIIRSRILSGSVTWIFESVIHIKKLYLEYLNVQGDVSWAGQVRLVVSERVGKGGTGPNPRRFYSRQVFPLLVKKIVKLFYGGLECVGHSFAFAAHL
jgi:hypothetical protein